MDQFTGTRAVAASHAFDTEALAAYLARNLSGFSGPMSVEQFKGGQSNPTYKLITPGRSYVMRSKPGPAAKLLPSAHAIEREFRVMKALAGSEVPVPEMLLLCVDEVLIGRAFYVMAFVEGRVLWEQSLPGFDKAGRRAIYEEMNRVIAALHNVDKSVTGLADYGKPGNYFERQIGRWGKQYLASLSPGALEPIAEMDRLIEWLPAHMPPSARDERQVAIVHGDYRLDNLVFAPDAPRVTAVLDWELSTLGHPLADFSYHCMSWHIPPGSFRGIGGLDLVELGIPPEREYVQMYCARTGRDAQGGADAVMTDWNFYLAYNLFRMASIMQGIAKRVVDGTASSAQAKATVGSAARLAQAGWAFAQQN